MWYMMYMEELLQRLKRIQYISRTTKNLSNFNMKKLLLLLLLPLTLFGQKETGDQIGRVTGIEAILAVDGLPLFEFMAPNIDKMLTSEYMGNRNMISSSVTNGSYSVMQPGSGYSLPFSKDGVRLSFGGSGMSAKEWTTPLDGFMLSSPQGGGTFAPKANEGLSFIFKRYITCFF